MFSVSMGIFISVHSCNSWLKKQYMKLIFVPYGTSPAFYLKPDTALLRNNQPFFYPDFTKDVRATLALVLRINRLGRSIGKQFAARYFDAVGVGMDIVAYDLLQQCEQLHLPADCARSFDYAAPIGPDFVSITKNIVDYNLQLFHNGAALQAAAPLLAHSPEEIIAHISQFLTLKIGDYLYLHTPLTTGPLQIGDTLTASLDGKEMLRMDVK